MHVQDFNTYSDNYIALIQGESRTIRTGLVL